MPAKVMPSFSKLLDFRPPPGLEQEDSNLFPRAPMPRHPLKDCSNTLEDNLPPQQSPGGEQVDSKKRKMCTSPPPCGLSNHGPVANDDGKLCFTFPVKASNFKGKSRSLALDKFDATIDGRAVPFQLHINAEQPAEEARGWSFKRANGRGKIELKCRDEAPPERELEFSFSIGKETNHQTIVRHNFSQRPGAGLPKDQAVWSFREAEDHGIIYVHVQLAKSRLAA